MKIGAARTVESPTRAIPHPLPTGCRDGPAILSAGMLLACSFRAPRSLCRVGLYVDWLQDQRWILVRALKDSRRLVLPLIGRRACLPTALFPFSSTAAGQ